MNEELALIEELRDTISPAQDMQYTAQGDRQERAADTIERLIRERDEARAERDEARQLFGEALDVAEALAEAEARGFERGVREAADAVEEHETNWKVGPSENKAEVRAAILALLDPVTLQEPEA